MSTANLSCDWIQDIGTIIYSVNAMIYLIDDGTFNMIELSQGINPYISSDNQIIVFERDSNIYKTNLNGSNVVHLTKNQGENSTPIWQSF